MNHIKAIDFLESLNAFGIKPGLERITRLLAALGTPQSKYKTIHVAGTNGKGSVCAMLSKILSTAGLKVGLFTSPHLIDYRERIKIDDVMIKPSDFDDEIGRVKKIIDEIVADGGESPTQFEALTAMALDYCSRNGVKYAVIEVGLGGLLDSTNVITPAVSVITNVGWDHADRCGGTLEGIARHKAGIIKKNIPVVTAARGEPLRIIEEAAKKLSAPLYVVDENNFIPPVRLNLKGEYQRENAAVAIKAAELLNEPSITPTIIADALEHVQWAGRFEIFSIDGRTIIIDGAHNPDGARALRQSLDAQFPDRPRKFLFGVLGDKDFDTMIDVLFRPSDEVIVTRPNSERAADPSVVCRRLKCNSIRAEPIENLNDAFNAWIEGKGGNDTIEGNGGNDTILIAAGSLYMIGAVRKQLGMRN